MKDTNFQFAESKTKPIVNAQTSQGSCQASLRKSNPVQQKITNKFLAKRPSQTQISSATTACTVKATTAQKQAATLINKQTSRTGSASVTTRTTAISSTSGRRRRPLKKRVAPESSVKIGIKRQSSINMSKCDHKLPHTPNHLDLLTLALPRVNGSTTALKTRHLSRT